MRDIVDAARELLKDESRFVELAQLIGRLAVEVDPRLEDPDLTFFLAIDSESDGLAFGKSLDLWSPEVRLAKQHEFDDFVRFYRPPALEHASILIGRYGTA